MQGCAEKIRKMGQSAGCMLNPMTGRESEVGITPVETARKVLIVGGGVAGMETAIICARRGHDVVLFEKEPELGGNFRLAAIPPGKGEICSFIAWQKQELDKYKVRIELNSFVDENSILREKPDVVVVATGSTPVSFSVPSDGIAAVSALDVLAGRTVVGDRVVIVGGGMVGAETANHLANHGKKVCLVEVKADIAADEELNTRFLLLEDLRKADVTAYVNCTVSGIDSNGVNILLDGRALHLPADTVVFALGGNPENAFAETRRGETPRWLIVGDSKKMGNAMDAVLDGFFAGLNID
jgi:NADPH-dependent 2,4-dienoyl-CoA reductase/sulfur reductase-like enzyme